VNRRVFMLLGGGAILLLVAYIGFPLAFEKWLMPEAELEHNGYGGYSPDDRPNGMARVQLWSGDAHWFKNRTAKNRVRFVIARGQTFVGDEPIAREKIRTYLDQKVLDREATSVVIVPAKGSSWGEIFPVIDECRRSRVRVVLLMEYEDPRPPL
jgi:biopolymer transport protein ExbD